ncbi:MAG: class I SAM-dependent methyltransferase [Blautia sp.]|nr:class I SAM-dependent methyltransferase [Blautia sp.]MCM1201378.1 class I SAM-dependent methyltransferase [Bacteroides fragilis]
MLKAYDYSDKDPEPRSEEEKKLFQEEKKIAQEFVIGHHSRKADTSCPVCGSNKTRYIFARWDIDYQFCEECSSIFVPVEAEVMRQYLQLEKMKALRNSAEYQAYAEQRRTGIWSDLIMWAEFRSYRYLGSNRSLEIVDYGNKYVGFVNLIRQSKMTGKYELTDSVLNIDTDAVEKADIIFYMNQLQHEIHPIQTLTGLKDRLKTEGLLILNTRLGSGFDILTLKGGADDIFPYEHVMLPSKKGLQHILEKAGYELLEITTPGTRDMETVLQNRQRIEDSNFFIKYLLDNADKTILTDFQQFLQKSGLSSFAQAVARIRKQG